MRAEQTTKQREKNLIFLIEDSKELKFNFNIIKSYSNQLKEIQEEIKKDEDKKKYFKIKNG